MNDKEKFSKLHGVYREVETRTSSKVSSTDYDKVAVSYSERKVKNFRIDPDRKSRKEMGLSPISFSDRDEFLKMIEKIDLTSMTDDVREYFINFTDKVASQPTDAELFIGALLRSVVVGAKDKDMSVVNYLKSLGISPYLYANAIYELNELGINV